MRTIFTMFCVALVCLAATAAVLAEESASQTQTGQPREKEPAVAPAATAAARESAGATSTSGPTVSAVPDVAINQAEREAIAAGELRMESPTDEIPPLLHAPSPMMQQIDAVMAEQARDLQELKTTLATVRTSAQAIQLQRQAEEIKRQSELEILQIQARFARDRGDEELAASIEAAIDWIQDPPPPPAPQHERPAPAIDR
jgi:hypothetical protein